MVEVMQKSVREKIDAFLAAGRFAVVGASNDRSKYGNRVLRFYQHSGRDVVPVNPNADIVEGLPAAASLSCIDPPVRAISVITQPHVTELIVQQAIELGIRHVWMQPGAESVQAIAACEQAGVNVLHSGACILVDAD